MSTERDIERHEARIIDGASERNWEEDHEANERARAVKTHANKSHALCDQMAGILMDATAKAMGKPRRTT